MTDTRVALLRGINVGSAKRIAMADLKKLVEVLGYGDVRTLLNSGNVVFTVPKRSPGDAAKRIQDAIEAKLRVTTQVTVLSRDDVAGCIGKHPLSKIADDPARLLVMVPHDPKAIARLKPLLKERWAPEALALGPRVAWLWCAEGIVDSPLWATVNRTLENAVTSRNLATMTKLLALIEATDS